MVKYLFGSLLFLAVFSSSGSEKTVHPLVPRSDKSGPTLPAPIDTEASQSLSPSRSGEEITQSNGDNGDTRQEGVPVPTGLTWTEKGLLAGAGIGAALAVGADSWSGGIGAVIFSSMVMGMVGHIPDMCGYYFRERKRKKLYPELFE